MNQDIEAELRMLLSEGQKIEAIKRYRQHFGAGLKEAKDAIDALERDGELPSMARRKSNATIRLDARAGY
jgi:hypothetical protein